MQIIFKFRGISFLIFVAFHFQLLGCFVFNFLGFCLGHVNNVRHTYIIISHFNMSNVVLTWFRVLARCTISFARNLSEDCAV